MTLMEGLAIAGGLVLAAVVAHGAWATRRARPRRPEASGGDRVEPVMGHHGGDATLDAAADSAAATGESADGAADPRPDGTAPGTLAALRLPVPRKSARLDPLIDAIALLRLEAPVTGEAALVHLPPSRRAGNKPFLIEGLNATTDDWELPMPGQRYALFQAGVQLANRNGALNEIEYSEFVQKLQGFAEGVGAMVELPDMLEVVAQARELDQFANAHDAQLTLTLRANGPSWTVAYLQQAAGRHGFLPGVLPGRLVMAGAEDGAPPVLVLGYDAQAALADDPNVSAVRKVQLSLDVPQTPEAAEPFPLWHETARRLAADIDATMVDDQSRPVTLHAFAAIGEDLAVLYRALAARDLAAGTPAARRLFS
jgi:ZipA, C-terminal FtsZ-binding domain